MTYSTRDNPVEAAFEVAIRMSVPKHGFAYCSWHRIADIALASILKLVLIVDQSAPLAHQTARLGD